MSLLSLPRGSGLLLHPTSLPGRYMVGDFGGTKELFAFFSDAGLRYWQILPLCPPSAGNSPYSSASALGLNPVLASLDSFVDQGLLTRQEADTCVRPQQHRVDYQDVVSQKLPLVLLAAKRFAADASTLKARTEFALQHPWAGELALFFALKHAQAGQPWWKWPVEWRDRQEAALADASERHVHDIAQHLSLQLLLQQQWQQVQRDARAHKVNIVGDLPIYVDGDSADVWANRQQFQLDGQGQPKQVAGVPPDYFSELGQLWGNPLYNWQHHQADGHAWWIKRLQRAFSLFDVVRIDHFRGFADYWSVPVGSPDARPGKWNPGPGRALFDDVEKALGSLAIIAEDLGIIDDKVTALREALLMPGMRVLQFAFGEDGSNPFLPHHHERNTVVYTGTHDNDTTLGFWRNTSERVRDHVRRYIASDGHDIVYDFIRMALASPAHLAVIPLQDVLAQDSTHRMNVPSVAEGNWSYRAPSDAFQHGVARRLREMNELYGRC